MHENVNFKDKKKVDVTIKNSKNIEKNFDITFKKDFFINMKLFGP